MQAYFNGQIIPKEKVAVSPEDRGFLFGDGVYEAILSRRGGLFRLNDHFRRLERSLRETRIPMPDMEMLKKDVLKLIRTNGLAQSDALAYIQVTRGVASRRHAFPPASTPPTVYAAVTPFEPDREEMENGVGILLVPDIRWRRCDIKAVGLLPNVMAQQKALESGAYEAVFVRGRTVTEGSHTNTAALLRGRLVTHPEGPRILSGVTRHAVLELCRQLEIAVEEKPVPVDRYRQASEIVLFGTSTMIMPVVRVNGKTVGDGTPGPVTRRLQHAFFKMLDAETGVVKRKA